VAELKRLGGDVAFERFKTAPAFKRARRFPKLRPVEVGEWDVSDTTVNDLARRLGGDRALASKIVALQRKFPRGTVPELVVYDWLRRQGYSFAYQVELYGGRRFEGGLVPDFVLFQDRTNADVWQVQGEYWHSISRKGFKDKGDNWRMLGQIIQGATVKRVIELWEDDLYLKRPQVFYLALAGLSLR
jgi:hypothetical protein